LELELRVKGREGKEPTRSTVLPVFWTRTKEAKTGAKSYL